VARRGGIDPCLQSTPKLSETVAELAINGSADRPQTASVGLRCGQHWWSGCLARRKNTVKRSLTFDPRRLASSSRSQVSVRSGSGALLLTCWASSAVVRRCAVAVAGIVTQLVTGYGCLWSQTGMPAAMASRMVAVVPGLAPRRNAAQPSAPSVTISALRRCPAARP
jgi:hypothetical protein